MNYHDKTLFALDQIIKEDSNIVACFVFGSYVSNEMSVRNFREIRIFDNKNFLLSKYDLTDINPDIDILCVSDDVSQTTEHFNKRMMDVSNYFVTVNLVSRDVFENELLLDQPTAIKRIILYRKLLIIKGNEYIDEMRLEAKKIEKPIDKIFQDEFDFKKEYLRMLAKYNIDMIIISRADYEKFFPNILKFIVGTMHAGFPQNRSKLVYPKPMGLKVEVDLSETYLKDLP